MSCQAIGSINTAVLATGAAKTYHQAVKASCNVIFNRYIHQVKNTV